MKLIFFHIQNRIIQTDHLKKSHFKSNQIHISNIQSNPYFKSNQNHVSQRARAKQDSRARLSVEPEALERRVDERARPAHGNRVVGERRRDERLGEALAAHKGDERGRVERDAVRYDDGRAAKEQRAHALPHKEDVAADARAGRVAREPDAPQVRRDRRAVRRRNALGLAGRARRVDHVALRFRARFVRRLGAPRRQRGGGAVLLWRAGR